MLYLNSQGIAHCDLALRNLLVSKVKENNETKYTVKISDFG
jgi:serine/threonine protein kinase